MYKNIIGQNGLTSEVTILRKDGVIIPFDPANTDAQQFAKWIQDGNVPEAAEEGGTVSAEWVAEIIAKLLPNG